MFCVDDKFKDEIRRAVKAHGAASSVHGTTGVTLSVWDNSVYWVTEVPAILSGGQTNSGHWQEIEPQTLKQLACAAEGEDWEERLKKELNDLESRSSSTTTDVCGPYAVSFEAREKYSDARVETPHLPKELMDYIMG